MLTVLSCIATGHDLRYVALAAFICTIGSALSMRLFARIRRTDGARRLHWLFLAGLVAGGTIWATHFAAMLGYDIPLGRSFEPFLTKVSLGIAVVFSLVGLWIAGRAGNGWGIELGGAVLGAGIVTMHYTGMAAMQVPGVIQWDKGLIAWSVFFGVGFGTLTTSRISRPITRFCKYGATASMVLAICSMHFTGMGAATVVPLPGIPVPEQAISDGVLLMTVVAVLLVIMATAASAYTIDLHGAREASERYKHLALHDPLTGLANRNHLAIRLDEMLSGSVDDPGRLAVVGLDLDRFKDVNDVHGHAAGDALLREIAQRAASAIGPDAFLARIGGDEFIAVKRDVFTRKEAVQFAESLRDAITAPIAWKGNAVAVGCSIGIAMYPDDGRDAETLTARADLAVYRAKSLGRNKIRIFEPGMDEESRSRAALAIDLRRALEEGQFELHYQPQNDAVSRKIVGFEALLRWNHPERGRIPPDAFIPIAEETGLIIDIGDWVLRTACLEAASWSQPYRVAVNVAPLQLAQGSLPERVADTLKATGLDPERLEIELTESGIISDQQHALHVIRSLKALGVTVAMDDFGTGYSSLSTLQNFPFDKIKIDRGFVHSVGQDAQAAAIVKATILLGTSLNIPVLAEGVETEDHLAFLREQGCTTVQGYLFGLPRPASEIPALMDKSEIALYRTTDSGEEMSREARRKSA